jgi:hypothetical protein
VFYTPDLTFDCGFQRFKWNIQEDTYSATEYIASDETAFNLFVIDSDE